jgi:hypothetical protein
MLKSGVSKWECTRPGWRIARAFLALLVALGLGSPGTARGGEPAETNCRFGLVFQGDLNGHQADYQMDQLNVGSYLDGKPNTWPDLPDGAEYIPVLALRNLPEPPEPVTVWVQAHPGATWLIGDEPDNPLRDNLTAEAYAARYYELATLIRGLDQEAQLGFGGIAQPSPIRMRYLARAWDELIRLAGGSQAASKLVDIWNIHAFYLSEAKDDPTGAGIPPGFEDDAGDAYGEIPISYSYFSSFIIPRLKEFRTWMFTRNEQSKPLWISSYGVWPSQDKIPNNRTKNFMTQSFTFFINAINQNTNLHDEDGAVVQRWFWYSLNGSMELHDGSLFNSITNIPTTITDIGDEFINYINSIGFTDNYLATELITNTNNFPGLHTSAEEQISLTIANIGNRSIGTTTTINLWDGDPREDGKLIHSQDLPHPLPGCGSTETLLFSWIGVVPYQPHALYVGIGPLVDGNLTRFDVVTGPPRTFLPLVHGGAGSPP